MTQASLLPLAAVAVPALTGLVIVALRHHRTQRDATLVVGAVITFAVVAGLLPDVLAGDVPTTRLGELLPGVELSLRADGMGMFFALLASFLWVLAGFYAIGYMRGDAARNQTRFYAFYAMCLGTAFAVAFAGDLLTFFIAYELLTVTTYPLVTHKGDAEALAAGRSYLGYLIGGGAAVLLGILIVFALTGEVAFQAGGFVGDALGTGLGVLAFVLFAVGFGTKAGLMPLHAWLPGAMVAPTPVSALLHAVAVVKAGVFAFGRTIGFVFGPDVLAGWGVQHLLAAAAAITILVASIVALRQDHLKRRLAYSTIAHLSFIVLGFSLLSPSAFEGSLLHIVNHGILKITLFFAAGAIHIAAHKDYVSELDGIGRRMPFTMTAFAVASYGLAGLPPMGGFLSKWHLVLGALEAEQYLLAGVMVASGIFTAGYLFPVVYRAFFRPEPVGAHAQHLDALATTAPPTGDAPTATDVAGSTASEPGGPGPTSATDAGSGHGGHGNADHGGHGNGGHGGHGNAGQGDATHDGDAHNADHGQADATHDGDAHHADHGEAPASMVVPLCVTAAVGLLLGLGDLTGIYELADAVAGAVTGGGR